MGLYTLLVEEKEDIYWRRKCVSMNQSHLNSNFQNAKNIP